MPAVPHVMRHRRGWIVAAAIAAAAAAAAAWPIPEALGSAGAARGRAAIIAATLTATSLVPLIAGRFRLPLAFALGGAVLLLVLGGGAYYYNSSVQGRCVITYNGRQVLIGTQLTALGESFKRAHPDETAADFYDSTPGDPSKVWTRDSMEWCRSRVASTYFLWIPLLIGSMASAALAIQGARLSVPAAAAPEAAAPEAAAIAEVPPRYDVFISYRHGGADADIARQLLDALEADGYAVAIDERDFPANASFLQEMERCIRESRHTVAIISSRYLQSGHCEEEAIVCKVLDMGQRRRRLIPFVIEKVPMPAWLFGIVGIDCTTADPLVDPIEKLKSTLGPPLRLRDGGAAV